MFWVVSQFQYSVPTCKETQNFPLPAHDHFETALPGANIKNSWPPLQKLVMLPTLFNYQTPLHKGEWLKH
jgi:hypothetical protein